MFGYGRYGVAMLARFGWVLLAAAVTIPSARAADYITVPSAGCDCGSAMITIYDVEPGVVTRHWTDCVCRYEPIGHGLPWSTAPVGISDDVPFMEPWRRW